MVSPPSQLHYFSLLKKCEKAFLENSSTSLEGLVVGAIRRSLELAEAMESRAFGAKKERTSLYILKMRRSDWTTLTIGTFVLIFSLYIRFFVRLPPLPLT